MKKSNLILSFFFLIAIFSCNTKSQIMTLLKSGDKDDVISGAKKAGQRKNKEFIPLLLENAADWRRSTNFEFKGVTVYQAKMEALKNIFSASPSTPITPIPDSIVIKFYNELYQTEIKKNNPDP